MADFTLPELGENVSTGDVLRVLVKAGDPLAIEQPVLEQHVEGHRRDSGPDEGGTGRGTRDAAADAQSAAASAEPPRPSPLRQSGNVVDISRGARQPAEAAAAEIPPAPAAPSVRRLA